tara:strand:+ start:2148 stop:2333 length:186 start_codon:yes stop_codon:yes gene_type:complete
MQFIKNSSQSKSNIILKLILKISAVFALIFVLIILLNKIDFPAPLKEIEKKIPNENLKIVK